MFVHANCILLKSIFVLVLIFCTLSWFFSTSLFAQTRDEIILQKFKQQSRDLGIDTDEHAFRLWLKQKRYDEIYLKSHDDDIFDRYLTENVFQDVPFIAPIFAPNTV